MTNRDRAGLPGRWTYPQEQQQEPRHRIHPAKRSAARTDMHALMTASGVGKFENLTRLLSVCRI